MEEIKIAGYRDALTVFEERLKSAIIELDSVDRVDVERLTTTDGYALRHPRGIFGLLYNADQFLPRDDIRGGAVILKRDLEIGVASIIRYYDNAGQPVDQQPMMPGEYTELAIKALTGIEVFNNRPQNERAIIPLRTDPIDERDGIWRYLTTFRIPLDYMK